MSLAGEPDGEPLLEAALGTGTVNEWQAALRVAGVPCGKVNDVAGAIAYASELGLDPVHDLGGEHLPQVRSPVHLSATPPARPGPPPRLGEHTQEVLGWLRERRDRQLSTPGVAAGPPEHPEAS